MPSLGVYIGSMFLAAALLAGLLIWATSEASDRCAEQGGRLESDLASMMPIIVDKVVIYQPIYDFKCVMPQP